MDQHPGVDRNDAECLYRFLAAPGVQELDSVDTPPGGIVMCQVPLY